MKSKIKNFTNFINNVNKNNNLSQKSNSNILEKSELNNNIDNNITINKQINEKNNYINFVEEANNNGELTPIKLNSYKSNNNLKNINKKEKGKKPVISDEFINGNSFVQSDIDEIRSIFNPNDLKNYALNDKYLDASNLFDNSDDINIKKEEITINDLDPKIKDVTLLFVLSPNYYELLVHERAKKAFNFSKKK